MNRPPGGDHETWPPVPTVPVDTGGQRLPPPWLMTVPLEVLLFAVFAVVVSLGQLCLTFGGFAFPGLRKWDEAIHPYVGGLSVMYLFCLYPAYHVLFKSDARFPKGSEKMS